MPSSHLRPPTPVRHLELAGPASLGLTLSLLTACGPILSLPDAGSAGPAADGGLSDDGGTGPDTQAVAGYFWDTQVVQRLAAPDLDPTLVVERADLGPERFIDDLALSPDGTQLAISAGTMDINHRSALMIGPSDGSAPFTTVYEADDHSDFKGLSWSDDGNWIGLLANIPGGNEPRGEWRAFVLSPTTGDLSAVSPTVPPPAEQNGDDEFTEVVFAPGASAERAFVAAYKEYAMFSAGGIWVTSLPSFSRVHVFSDEEYAPSAPQWDAEPRVYTIAREGTPSRLYRANPDGSGLEQVPGTALTNDEGEADINQFAISPDGASIAFLANAPDPERGFLYVIDVDGGQARLVAEAPEGQRFGDSIAWSHDGAHLAVRWGDQLVFVQANDVGGVRLVSEAQTSPWVFAFAHDSSRLYLITRSRRLFAITDFTAADQTWSSIDTGIKGDSAFSGYAGLALPGAPGLRID